MVRQLNLAVIMQSLRESGSMSRAALAELTGLNKTTVSSLVRELSAQGFVYEPGESAPGTGRPAVLLELNPAAGFIIAAELGGDFISVVLADFAAKVVWQQREQTSANQGQDALLQRLLALLHTAQVKIPANGRLLGVTIGVPGLVDRSSGHILFAPSLRWQDIGLRELLPQFSAVPLLIDNDAALAALGEQYLGAAQGCDEVLYMSAGTGLGAGLIHGGQLVRGASGLAGEVGHMTLDPTGELCACGNRGCWETQVSQRALLRNVRQAIAAGQPSSLPDGHQAAITLPMVARAADAGDAAALTAVRRLGEHLGIGIAALVNALNPELVILGGPLSILSQHLLPIVDHELEQRALRWNRSAAQVVVARYGSDACIMGGVAWVLQTVLAQLGTGTPVQHAKNSLPLALTV
jgi:glucokinase-like ROK family protein